MTLKGRASPVKGAEKFQIFDLYAEYVFVAVLDVLRVDILGPDGCGNLRSGLQAGGRALEGDIADLDRAIGLERPGRKFMEPMKSATKAVAGVP